MKVQMGQFKKFSKDLAYRYIQLGSGSSGCWGLGREVRVLSSSSCADKTWKDKHIQSIAEVPLSKVLNLPMPTQDPSTLHPVVDPAFTHYVPTPLPQNG